MKIAIKSRDDFHRLVRAVGDLVEIQIIGGNELIAQEMFADISVPRFPISSAGTIHQHERHKLALASLHERERLETFVHRAEAARKKDDRVRMPDENQFAREEIFERDELLVFLDDGIGALFPRQTDVHAETVFRS